MPSPLPVLYAARHPETGRWLVDADEGFVRAAAGYEGAAVLRVDLAALVRAARAARRYAELDGLPCDYEDGVPDVCPGVENNGGPCHWCDLRAALAALGDSALLGKGE